jgi:small subunit ribosomal protein S6
VVLLHPDLEIDVDAPVAKIEKIISGAGGKITKRDNWGKKRLAYPVKKQQFGVYIYFELELPAEGVRQIESQLLITEEVIRFLLVRQVAAQQAGKAAGAQAATKEAAEAAVEKE